MAENSEKWNKAAKGFKQYIKLEKGLSDNTVEAYMRDSTNFANFILHQYDVPPSKVEQYMVERYLAYLYSECKHSKSSQARELSGVKAFFNYLLVNDKIEQSPTEMIATPKRTRQLPDVLTVEEVEQIINSIPLDTTKGKRDRAMLELMYSCGLRVTELISLKLSDLFLELLVFLDERIVVGKDRYKAVNSRRRATCTPLKRLCRRFESASDYVRLTKCGKSCGDEYEHYGYCHTSYKKFASCELHIPRSFLAEFPKLSCSVTEQITKLLLAFHNA
jgi:site-specific recombinase XerC